MRDVCRNFDKATYDFCKHHGIGTRHTVRWVGGSLNVQDPRIQKIAQAHGVSVYQVCLRWVTQIGSPMAVSSTKLSHDLSDLNIFSFELSSEEMDVLTGI